MAISQNRKTGAGSFEPAPVAFFPSDSVHFLEQVAVGIVPAGQIERAVRVAQVGIAEAETVIPVRDARAGRADAQRGIAELIEVIRRRAALEAETAVGVIPEHALGHVGGDPAVFDGDGLRTDRRAVVRHGIVAAVGVDRENVAAAGREPAHGVIGRGLHRLGVAVAAGGAGVDVIAVFLRADIAVARCRDRLGVAFAAGAGISADAGRRARRRRGDGGRVGMGVDRDGIAHAADDGAGRALGHAGNRHVIARRDRAIELPPLVRVRIAGIGARKRCAVAVEIGIAEADGEGAAEIRDREDLRRSGQRHACRAGALREVQVTAVRALHGVAAGDRRDGPQGVRQVARRAVGRAGQAAHSARAVPGAVVR